MVWPWEAFQSTLPARGATEYLQHAPGQNCISIHAPRTGSDGRCRYHSFRHTHFNPRSPHGERHLSDWLLLQSNINFNPRSPHGERRLRISAHTVSRKLFQSTLPARGATGAAPEGRNGSGISIHAPRTGSDVISRSFLSVLQVDFNPRSPHGERQKNLSKGHCVMRHFNPRSPHGERLFGAAHRLPHGGISIHAPRTGSDRCPCKRTTSRGNFNPRSPHGERPPRGTNEAAEWHFNPRSPHGERLSVSARCSQVYCISIHAPRTGSDNNILPISSLC